MTRLVTKNMSTLLKKLKELREILLAFEGDELWELEDAPPSCPSCASLRARLERVEAAARGLEESLVWYEKGGSVSMEHERAEQVMDARVKLRAALAKEET